MSSFHHRLYVTDDKDAIEHQILGQGQYTDILRVHPLSPRQLQMLISGRAAGRRCAVIATPAETKSFPLSVINNCQI